ncbi:O-antigen ligase family protein [Desulfosediminicola flagellatus]|uniref:O-antigen ligase family protein n=1 Tax=Desulfosediminicola flagellatus TaxID=2569541 RepID=UPI0010AC37A5|nr:O-antigen ligase family protein [Desulfosediminicola flagellatus]
MKFIFACLFVSLYIVRPFEFIPSLYGSRILLLCGVLGLLSVILSSINTNHKKWCANDSLIVGFFLAILLSHVTQFYLAGVIASFNKFLPAFFGYFLLSYSVETKKQVIMVCYVIVFCCCFVAVEGWFEYSRGVSYFGVEPLFQAYTSNGERLIHTRIKWLGPFSDPNDLALLFVLPFPFLIARFKQNKIISLIALALLVLGIYLTNSRGGVLSLFVAITVYFVLLYRNTKGMILSVIVIGLLFILGPSRLGEISAGESSASGRLDAWYAGYQMFKESPLFGVGMGMFTDFHELTAHNSFVLIMAELGVFGLFFFVGFFWIPLKSFKSFLWGEQRNDLSPEDIALFSAFGACLAAVVTSMSFLSRSYVFLPYLLVALIVRFGWVFSSREFMFEPGNNVIKQISMLTVLGIIGVNIFIKIFI